MGWLPDPPTWESYPRNAPRRPGRGGGARWGSGWVAGRRPSRYRVKPGDGTALMECREPTCRAPFDPNYPVPRGGLCRECRERERRDKPVLPGLEDLGEPH